MQPGDGQAAEVTQPTTVGTTGAATDGAATAPAGDTHPGPTAPGTAAPGTAQTRCPTGNDGGSTDSSVRIAITIINIAGAAGNQTAGVPTPEKQRLYWQAYAWVADDDRQWPFSFVNLCETLGLDIEAIRRQSFDLATPPGQSAPTVVAARGTPLGKAA